MKPIAFNALSTVQKYLLMDIVSSHADEDLSGLSARVAKRLNALVGHSYAASEYDAESVTEAVRFVRAYPQLTTLLMLQSAQAAVYALSDVPHEVRNTTDAECMYEKTLLLLEEYRLNDKLDDFLRWHSEWKTGARAGVLNDSIDLKTYIAYRWKNSGSTATNHAPFPAALFETQDLEGALSSIRSVREETNTLGHEHHFAGTGQRLVLRHCKDAFSAMGFVDAMEMYNSAPESLPQSGPVAQLMSDYIRAHGTVPPAGWVAAAPFAFGEQPGSLDLKTVQEGLDRMADTLLLFDPTAIAHQLSEVARKHQPLAAKPEFYARFEAPSTKTQLIDAQLKTVFSYGRGFTRPSLSDEQLDTLKAELAQINFAKHGSAPNWPALEQRIQQLQATMKNEAGAWFSDRELFFLAVEKALPGYWTPDEIEDCFEQLQYVDFDLDDASAKGELGDLGDQFLRLTRYCWDQYIEPAVIASSES